MLGISRVCMLQGSLTIRDDLRTQQQGYIERLVERQSSAVKLDAEEAEKKQAEEKTIIDVSWLNPFIRVHHIPATLTIRLLSTRTPLSLHLYM